MNSSEQNLNDDRAKEPVPYMNTLTAVSNKVTKLGYTDTFKVTKQGLHSAQRDKFYGPDEIIVTDFYRFEGQSDPADNSILYVIETNDGAKGMLVDAYGPYADAVVNNFITDVEEINKKVVKGDK